MADPIPLRQTPPPIVNDSPTDGNLGIVVGQNLKRLRLKNDYSLERLAKLSGVSRAMLGQIELGRSVPTINIVFKIAQAFGVPFSALLVAHGARKVRLLPAGESKTLTSASGDFSSRALFPFDSERKTEFYELRLAPNAAEIADAHTVGAIENLVVVKGVVEIEAHETRYRLGQGDAILFEADIPHVYRNVGADEALIYLVMTYVDLVG